MTDRKPDASIATFLDILLPGDADWPSATKAIADSGAWLATLTEPERTWIMLTSARIEALPPAARFAAMQQLEHDEPAPFASVLRALYDAYYASEAAHQATLALAEAGPVDQSAFFDPSQ